MQIRPAYFFPKIFMRLTPHFTPLHDIGCPLTDPFSSGRSFGSACESVPPARRDFRSALFSPLTPHFAIPLQRHALSLYPTGSSGISSALILAASPCFTNIIVTTASPEAIAA